MTETSVLNGNRIDRISVPEALQAALAHHQAGRLDEAEAVYRHILGFAPENGDALHLMGVVRLQRGNAEDAVSLIERAIAFNGGAPAYHNNLGNAFKILGKPAKAGEAYRRAITLLPGFADAHNNLGTLHLAAGAAAKAEASFRQALTTAPKAAGTLFNLGLALRAQDRLEEAAASFRKAVVSSPGHIEARAALSAALLGLGRLDEARGEAEAAVRQKPRHAAALTALGNVHSQEADWARTADCYRRAIAADPGHAQAHNNLGHALSEQGQLEEAAACFRRALRLDPRYGDAEANLGSVLFRLDQVEAAAAALARATRIAPGNAEAHYNLGQTFEQRGRVEEAETAYRRAIAHDPGRATGFYGLSRIKRFAAGDPDLAEMEALAGTGGLSEKQDMHLHFALAKAYDDLGACDRAFAALSHANGLKGHDLQRRDLAFDRAEADARYRAIEGTFSAEFLARHAGLGDRARSPVFIVGMPGSGSTLLEQILSSHAEAHGAGALPDLAGLVQGLPGRLATETPYPACLSEAPESLWRDLAADYLAGLRRRAPLARLVTDKLPENHQRVGLIALILPEAKIIHCRRDPVDTCLSAYKRLFAAGQRFAYDLRELGLHYRRYDRLMAHWNRVLPGRVLEVRYEDLVADREAQTRRVLAHCGLDWDPLCLRLHEFDREVMTAGAPQFRRPIYRGSVRKWRRCEKHLAPLLEALGELVPAD